MEVAKPELLIHEKGEQVDTCPQIKQCPIYAGLSYDARNGWTPGVFVFFWDGPG